MTAQPDRSALLDEAREDEQPKQPVHFTSAVPIDPSTAPLPVQSPDSTAFWRDSVYPEGMTAGQVKAELDDFRFLMEQVPKVYMEVTGGLLSKPNYHASTVIAAFEDYLTRRVEEELEDLRAVEGSHERHGSNEHDFGSRIEHLEALVRRQQELLMQARGALDDIDCVSYEEASAVVAAIDALEPVKGETL